MGTECLLATRALERGGGHLRGRGKQEKASSDLTVVRSCRPRSGRGSWRESTTAKVGWRVNTTPLSLRVATHVTKESFPRPKCLTTLSAWWGCHIFTRRVFVWEGGVSCGGFNVENFRTTFLAVRGCGRGGTWCAWRREWVLLWVVNVMDKWRKDTKRLWLRLR